MERIEVSVNQVNFKGNDLQQLSSIHSFGNLVSYESDLKNAGPASEPVSTQRVLAHTYGVEDAPGAADNSELPGLVEHNIEGYLCHSFGKQGQMNVIDTASTADVAASVENNDEPCQSPQDATQSEEFTQPQTFRENTQRSAPVNRMFALDASIDTFHAFTKTVEALALQESVIDNKNITPASPKDVAKAIAEAQRKLAASQMEPPQRDEDSGNTEAVTITDDKLVSGVKAALSHSHSADDGGSVASLDGDTSTDAAYSSLDNVDNTLKPTVGNEMSVDEGGMEAHSTEDHGMRGSSQLIQIPSDTEDHGMRGSSQLIQIPSDTEDHGMRGSSQLIQIPSDQMVRMTETASWFSRVTSNTSPQPTVTDGSQVALTVGNGADNEPGQVPMTTKQQVKAINENANPNNEEVAMHDGNKQHNVINGGIRKVDRSDHQNNIHPQAADLSSLSGMSKQQQSENSNHDNSNGGYSESRIGVDTSVRLCSSSTSLRPSYHSTPSHSSVCRSSSEQLSSSDATQPSQHIDLHGAGDHVTRHVSRDDHVSRSWSVDSLGPDSGDLDAARCENAKLEGQLEVLYAEAKTSLSERAKLHAQIATLTQQVKVEEASRRNAVSERDAFGADLETLRQNRGRLEQIILDAHGLLEEKDQDHRVLQEDLVLSQEARDKLGETLKLAKEDAEARDDAVRALKEKVAELYVDFQTSNQNKILLEQEVKSLQAEVGSVTSSKEWYQEQLHVSQQAKAALQSDVTTVKGEVIAHTTHVERLRADNVRVKQQLSDMQKRLIQDKQMLARHLEAIEADMMEREATFMQIRCERDSVEQVLQSQMAQSGSAVALDDVVEQLNKSQAELKRRLAQIAILEHEHSELVKRLALSQESILERDRSIENLDATSVDAEIRVKQIRLELTSKDEELLEAREERNGLEVALQAAHEEKRVFDNALQTLKDDMSKVGQNFVQLKTELKQKKEEIFRLKARRNRVDEKLNSCDAGVSEKVENSCDTVSHESQVDDDATLLETLEQEKSNLERELEGVRATTKLDLERAHTSLSALEKDLSNTRSQLKTAQMEAASSGVERENAEGEVAAVRGRLVEMQLEVQSLRERNVCLDTEVLQASSSTSSHVEAMDHSRTENDALRSRLGQLQSESHRAIAKQKAKALKLGRDLEMLLREQRSDQVAHETQVTQLTERLTSADDQCEKLSAEVSTLQGRFNLDLDEQTDALQTELGQLKRNVQASEDEKQSLVAELRTNLRNAELQVEKYGSQVDCLEKDLLSAQEYIEQQREAASKWQQLSLDLEREKGRLAGVTQSHVTLKDHCRHLEGRLAAGESSTAAHTSQVVERLADREKEVAKMEELVRSLEDEVARERERTKDSRKQLMTEKGGHIKVRRQMETLLVDLDQLQVNVEQKTRRLVSVETDLQRAQQSEAQCQSEMERATGECESVRREMDRLQQSLEEEKQRDSVRTDEAKSLAWRLDEQRTALEAASTKLHLVVERHNVEVDSLQRALQSVTSELGSVREELLSVRQDKSSLHTKLTELRSALKTSLQQSKAVTTDSAHRPLDLESIEQLLQESSSVTTHSKPLTFLKATLSTLRGDISGLQDQVNEHSLAVQTSSESWREVEEQVKDLREVIRSSAASRETPHQLYTDDATVSPS